MKKISSLLFTLSLLAGLAACGVPTATEVSGTSGTSVAETQGITETPGYVVFSDAALEAKVRQEMGRPEGQISLAEAEEILELDLSNNTNAQLSEEQKIGDISSLRFFRNLFRLNLASNRIADIGALSEITGLRILNLSHNQVTDLSPLSGLNLTELTLNNNRITDISPLTNMKQLRMLDLVDNQITDVSGLGKPGKMRSLLLAGNPVTDYTALADIYTDLIKMDFEILSESDAIKFTDPVLERRIRENIGRPEGDITVAEAKMVTVLNLEMEEGSSGERIHDISALKYFSNLTELKLDWALSNNGEPMDISPLSNLNKLKVLSLKSCEVMDISPLAGLTALESIELQLNRIEDISPLAGLTNLQILSICSNPFTDLSPLGNLTSMKALFLFNVQISDLGPLANLTNLEALDLKNTGVHDISALSNLKKLTMLNLGGNPIEDFSPVNEIYPNLSSKDF